VWGWWFWFEGQKELKAETKKGEIKLRRGR